jgi:dolichol-phosphate mannosyltransferase
MTTARRVLVLTPTFNEQDNLARFVDELFAVLPDVHLLVIDDNSPDGTGALADELAARDERVAVLHRPRKLGLGTAYVDGFRYALSRDYDTVVEMDTDLSHDARHLPSLLAALDRGADLAVGSRNIPGGGVVGWGPGRNLISRGGSLYSRIILGVGVRDLTTGYKAYTREALERIDVDSLQSDGYAFQIETTYRALCHGLHVEEVPIVFVDRRAGHSKLDRSIVIEAVWAVWRLRLRKLLDR